VPASCRAALSSPQAFAAASSVTAAAAAVAAVAAAPLLVLACWCARLWLL